MLKFGNSLLKSSSGALLYIVRNFNPLELPAYTIRVKYKAGETPEIDADCTLVDAENNIWDIHKESNDWSSLFYWEPVIEIIAANSANVTNMSAMFSECPYLKKIDYIFDTRKVTDFSGMFGYCIDLEEIPMLDTRKAVYVNRMFWYTEKVQSGIIDMYVQLSNVSTILNHSECFNNCGTRTQTGSAELAQIPDDWK